MKKYGNAKEAFKAGYISNGGEAELLNDAYGSFVEGKPEPSIDDAYKGGVEATGSQPELPESDVTGPIPVAAETASTDDQEFEEKPKAKTKNKKNKKH